MSSVDGLQALPSHLQEEIEFDAVQKPVFMSHILRALATWQTAMHSHALVNAV